MSKHNGNDNGGDNQQVAKRPAPPRFYFQFQLRRDWKSDVKIAEIIAALKKERAYVTALRNGIRLIWDLCYERREDVLLELVPDIVERLQVRLKKDSDDNELIKRLERIESKLDEKALPEHAPLVAKKFNQIALPDDNDKVVVRVDTNAGADNAANFLGSAFGFQNYPAPAQKTAPAPKTSGGIKEMKIPKISAPSFDDESDDIVFKH